MSNLDGLQALVTGGASGIGLATAGLLCGQGAQVAVLDVAEQGPDGSLYGQADIRDDAAVQSAVATMLASLGLDVLVNNAGIGEQDRIEAHDDTEWHRVLDVNVSRMVRITRAVWPVPRTSSHAAIVNTCSIAATAGLPGRALDSASKGAVMSLTLAMAAHLIPEGIGVNTVHPGTADTPWVSRPLDSATDPAAERAAIEEHQPYGRLVHVGEVAATVAFLSSPDSGFTTGTSLAVHGGMAGHRLRPVGWG